MSVFDRLAVRIAVQAAIADEIIIDGPSTYSIVVPDKLIDRIAAIVAPFVVERGAEHG